MGLKGEVNLEERGLTLYEDRRKRKMRELHGNNLDSDNVVLDTLEPVSSLRNQNEAVPDIPTASPAWQACRQT